jgi:hypothetical protein
MSYVDAQQRIGVGEGQYNLWSRETRVWLVVFKGQWTPVSYEGCLFLLFTAREGELMSMGDAICPTN